jgi:uncharacterized membrane protein YphA (DoxX/SURF4 family)
VNLSPITAPYLAATLVLGAAGIAKLIRPADTATALRAAGFPVGAALVRVGAAAELAVAAAAVGDPSPLTGALVAAAYAAFAGFIVLALRRGWVLSSCGCFGRPDTPPTIAHAVLNGSAAASALWWAVSWPGKPGLSHLGRLFSHQPWHGGPLALVVVVLAGLSYLVWTDPLPAARR